MLLLAEERFSEAWQDLLTCHRLGRLIGRGGTMIELLVGIAIEEQIANKADVAFLEHSKLTSKQVSACLEDLQQLPPMPTVAILMTSAAEPKSVKPWRLATMKNGSDNAVASMVAA